MKKFDLQSKLHRSSLFVVAARTRLPKIGEEPACSVVALAPRRPMTLAEWGAGLFGFGADTPPPTVAWLVSEKNLFLSSEQVEEIIGTARRGSPILRGYGLANLMFLPNENSRISVLTLRSLNGVGEWGSGVVGFSGELKCHPGESRLLIRVP